MTISKITLVAALAAIALVATPALAQDAPADGLTVTGSATIVSDYRFRGISLSDRDATIQGGFGVSHDSGFYVGTWGSGLSGFGSLSGSNTEIEVYGGYPHDLGRIDRKSGVEGKGVSGRVDYGGRCVNE